jgi:leader peptidase (prepilin peptidase)/N-methyltransferase
VIAVFLGGALGSFAGVLLDRVPRGEPITGRSHCVCGAPVAPWDNVPVLSYLLRRGKARCCGATIPSWYLWVEIGGAALALAIYLLVIALVD